MKNRRKIKDKVVANAKFLMDSKMPRNTNFSSCSARQKISELIVEMIFENFSIKEKSQGILQRLKKVNRK